MTTPVRLHMGVVYSVKSSSVFTQGKVIATVDDSGLVTFKNTGTVTIVVSPDTEGFINNLLKLVNYIYKLDHTGTIDTKKLADILIKYLGIDIDRNVLAALLDACFAIKDIVGDSADAIQLTATAVKIIANILLKLKYNDTITFTVVDVCLARTLTLPVRIRYRRVPRSKWPLRTQNPLRPMFRILPGPPRMKVWPM